MSEQKNVKFDTIFTGDSGGYDISQDNMPLKVEITPNSSTTETVKVIYNIDKEEQYINNNKVEEGEVCIVMRNQLESYVDFEINENGELIVHGKNANNYSINEDQELIYTER